MNHILRSTPQLAVSAFRSYFEPLLWGVSFVKGLIHTESPSKSIVKSEFEKIKSALSGRKWYSIHNSLEIVATNALQRAALRQARINLVYSSSNQAYESLFDELYSNNAALESISKKLYVRSIHDLNVGLANSDRDHTYNIIIMDEAHRSLATEDIEAYKKVFNAAKHLGLSFASTRSFIDIEGSWEYINFPDSLDISDADVTLGAKALQLKIEEFISSMPELTNKSTGRA
ncbi:hypothetical protein AYI95_13025 [Shewanella xiamenensis]|nr:hypothetical protein AYI95_13025 [Shewanella xiamenensis]